MFLDLDIPMDDPLRPAKIAVNVAAPGFRISEKDGQIEWESDFIWLRAGHSFRALAERDLTM